MFDAKIMNEKKVSKRTFFVHPVKKKKFTKNEKGYGLFRFL